MSTIRIFHNPRCSKSRQTLSLLEQQGIDAQVIEYLKSPPTAAELKSILGKLDMSARELLRKGETDYKELNLSDQTLSEDDLIAAMIAHPKLIERPIVINADKAKLGRPPEAVLDIL